MDRRDRLSLTVAGAAGAGTLSGGGALSFRSYRSEDQTMFKGGLLWLIGIPLPIIVILWLLGYLS